MTRDNKQKINHLLETTPKDTLLTMKWLKEHDVSNKLAWWYTKSGWLKHIADGIYCFSGSEIDWVSAIAALQNQLDLAVYPGAKTALQLLGKSHYLGMSISNIQLFSTSTTNIPKWIYSDYWEGIFSIYKSKLFSSHNKSWLTTANISGKQLILSAPEKAAFEVCYLVPNIITFSEAALLIENLSRMRPMILQSLFEACESYKVKRLLLYLADYYEHQWLSDIDLRKIDLGKGKRMIAGGGQYNNKYQISVPNLGRKK